MTFDEYFVAAQRTRVPRSLAFDLNHAILGFTTEIGELATIVKRNVIYGRPLSDEARAEAEEEIGDILWYTTPALLALAESPDDLDTRIWYITSAGNSVPALTTDGCIRALVAANAAFIKAASNLEISKLAAGDAIAAVQRIAAICFYAATLFGSTPAAAMEKNIAKLRLRYPDKFTPELAEARLDKAGASARES